MSINNCLVLSVEYFLSQFGLIHAVNSNYYMHCFAGNALFDATQYEFFGQNVLDEVELGGLEDDGADCPPFGSVDDEYHLFDKGEVSCNF